MHSLSRVDRANNTKYGSYTRLILPEYAMDVVRAEELRLQLRFVSVELTISHCLL